MNVRFESGPVPRTPQEKIEEEMGFFPVHEDYQNADRATEKKLVQDALSNPEQMQKNEVKKLSNEDRLKEAVARYKAAQTQSQYFSHSSSTLDDLSTKVKFENITTPVPEKKTENTFISDPVEQIRIAYEKRNLNTTPERVSVASENSTRRPAEEKKPINKKDVIARLLEKARQENDSETIELLEMQRSETENETLVEKKEGVVSRENIIPEMQEIKTQQEQTPASTEKETQKQNSEEVTEEKIVDQQNETISSPEILPPSEETLYKLQEMGIKYEDLVRVVPDFATMSEGQQAYILVKAEEQGVEHIQERADRDFQRKIGEQKGFWGGVKKVFQSGKMRREANRNAANQHKGLNAFSKDIEHLTKHVSENGWDINLNQDGTYQIEYIQKPEGITEREAMFFDNYNRYATALSDIPYEWGLPTANSAEKKAYKKAYEDFGKCEKALRVALEQGGEEHPDILRWTFKTRSEIELNQFFSSYPDVSEKLNDMKNASFQSDLVKKIVNPAGAGLAVGSGARIFSKALYGLGGTVGASAIIGGIIGWRRKSSEFKEDAKGLRRGKERKETGDRVFDAKASTERINKLLAQIEKEQNVSRRERSLGALQDRLQILDERLKAGRVNFGKSKEQLENKTALMAAMTQAHLYRYELSEQAQAGKERKVDARITDYFKKQDTVSGDRRLKEKAKSAARAGLIGGGAALASWLVADYFGGDAKAMKAAVDAGTDLPEMEMPPKINPTNFEVSVDASPRGAIETFSNLQQELIEKYPNPELRPPHIQEFLSKSPTQLAMDENFYRPEDVNESAKIFKGGKLGFNEKGQLFYTDARNGMDILSGDGKFDGEHFDFKSYSEAKVAPQNIGSESVGTGAVPQAETAENIFSTSNTVEELKLGTVKEVKLSKNLSVDFSIDKGIRGGLVSTFHDVNPEDFNAYHKAYLNTDISSYINRLATETNFLETNVTSREKAEQDLRELVNQMIMRDQVLQEGGLNPNSEAYKILANERNEIEEFVNKKFGQGNDIIYDFDGKRYPDPNFGTGAESAGPSQGVESQPENVATPEATNTPETKTVRVRNNVIGQDFDFRFTKTPEGSLMYSNEGIDPNKIPNQYIEQRLGFNPDWRKASGLPLTFEDQPTYGRILGNIDRIKIALAGLDSFAPGTQEHQLFKSILNTTVKTIERDYPEIFNYQTN